MTHLENVNLTGLDRCPICMVTCLIRYFGIRAIWGLLRPFLSFTDMEQGTIGDMQQLGITESFIVKQQVLLSAAEAAEMILRVDDIIKAAPR